MSKKNGQMKNDSEIVIHKPNAIISGDIKRTLESKPRFTNRLYKTLWESLPVEMLGKIIDHYYTSGFINAERIYKSAHEAYVANRDDWDVLRFSCNAMDAVIALQSGKKELQDALKSTKETLDELYTDVVNGWGIYRSLSIQARLGDPGDFATNRPDVANDIKRRTQALEALYDGKGDDSLIHAIPPLNINIQGIVNPVTKKGRGSLDWLRKAWRQCEKDNPGLEPFEIRENLLTQLATFSFKDGYSIKPNLTADQRRAYLSLLSHRAQHSFSKYYYELFN